jgi:hypothetical protein
MKVVDRYHDAYLIKRHFEKIMISIEARMGASAGLLLAQKASQSNWVQGINLLIPLTAEFIQAEKS